jgi:glycosyltransferase involved in cell wall biosynthesis
MLEEQGLLRHLHTDFYAGDGGLNRSARFIIRKMGLISKSIMRMSQRACDLPAGRVRAHNVIAIRHALRQRFFGKRLGKIECYARFHREMSDAIIRSQTSPPRAIITFGWSHALFRHLHQTTALIQDQIDGHLHAHDILLQEKAQFHEWLPAPERAKQQATATSKSQKREVPEELELADAIICNSRWTAHCLGQLGVSASKCKVIPLSYEPSVSAMPNPRKTGYRPFTIGFLGTLTLLKGIHHLLAASKILGARTSLRFRIAGPLQICGEKLASFKNIEYLGKITRGEVDGFLRSCDILALPSMSEGFGLVQLEAMARGIPVIASDRTGDVVQDGINGLRVPAGDPDALAAAIESLATNRERYRSMHEAALRRSRDFSREEVGRLWKDAIVETIDAKK